MFLVAHKNNDFEITCVEEGPVLKIDITDGKDKGAQFWKDLFLMLLKSDVNDKDIFTKSWGNERKSGLIIKNANFHKLQLNFIDVYFALLGIERCQKHSSKVKEINELYCETCVQELYLTPVDYEI